MDESTTAEWQQILVETMDFEQGTLTAGFTFVNPNEKGRCGCGESFHV